MAVDNFLAFKRLMVKRNQELNKQVIEMMSRRAAGAKPAETAVVEEQKQLAEEAVVKQPPVPLGEDLKSVMKLAASLEAKEEEEMMKKALEISQRQEEERKRMIDQEEEMIRRAIEMSEAEERDRIKKVETEHSFAQQQTEIERRKAEMKTKEDKIKQD